MKMGKIILSMIIVLIVFAQTSELFAQTTVYLNVPEENLRNAPNGRKIGALLENTEMVAIAENENWVQVFLVGIGILGLILLGLFPQLTQPLIASLPAMFEHLGK